MNTQARNKVELKTIIEQPHIKPGIERFKASKRLTSHNLRTILLKQVRKQCTQTKVNQPEEHVINIHGLETHHQSKHLEILIKYLRVMHKRFWHLENSKESNH